jgi:hypothetical protein
MTKGEYCHNVEDRAASIMMGALLQDVVASFNVLVTEPSLPAIADGLQAVKYIAEILADKIGDTDEANKAYQFADEVLGIVLKNRTDLDE